MISGYNYSEIITNNDEISAKKEIDLLFSKGHYNKRKNFPKFQTWTNLHEDLKFLKFKNTFLNSCQLYLDKNFYSYKMTMWCYMDSFFNSILKNHEKQWHKHQHSLSGTLTLSGIYYLENPKNIGTEFENFKINPLPKTWYIFPSTLIHRPPKVLSFRKRYTLSADILVY